MLLSRPVKGAHCAATAIPAWILAVLLLCLVNGCTQQPSTATARLPADIQQLLNSPLLLSGSTVALSSSGTAPGPGTKPASEVWPVSETGADSLFDDPLAVNAEMRHFVHTYVSADASSRSKLQQLLEAMLHPGLLGMTYDPQKTYSAADAFYYRQGNCLAFSNLLVALGREAGLEVWFNEVEVPPSWGSPPTRSDQSVSTYLYYRHMNVVVKAGRELKVVDLDRDNSRPHYPQQRVSDDYALAQYYNNLSMAQLFDGQLGHAFVLLREAIIVEPGLSFLWGNLGTLFRRGGHFREAEVAYLKGLQLDPGDLMVISNLGRLYRQIGNPAQAERYDAMAARFRMANPYYRYHLALQALAEGDPDSALAHIRVALESDLQEPRFHTLAAEINVALGLTEAARTQRMMAARLGRDPAWQP